MLAGEARAGAPAPHFSARVWSPVPLGAPLRMDLDALRMDIPAGLSHKLKVTRAGKPVTGRWVEENRAPYTCGLRVRLRFVPRKPLARGEYLVRGIPRGSRGFHPTKQKVVVTARKDTTPPSFAGLQGVFCQRPNPLLGCRPFGLGLHPGKASDESKVRFRILLRQRGEPYRASAAVEAALLPYAPQGLFSLTGKGRYIVTLQAVDASDNAGGKLCEVPLDLPYSSCDKFPAAGKGAGRPTLPGLGSGMLRARCARPGPKPGQWTSAIDGVKLRFPGPSPAGKEKR